MALKKYKYNRDCKIELRPFEVEHKFIADTKVLLQYHVTAIASSGEKVNIGYTTTDAKDSKFAPIVQAQFPIELFPVVEKQIAEIKASYDIKRASAVPEASGKAGPS